jgi:hypothetical protein
MWLINGTPPRNRRGDRDEEDSRPVLRIVRNEAERDVTDAVDVSYGGTPAS